MKDQDETNPVSANPVAESPFAPCAETEKALLAVLAPYSLAERERAIRFCEHVQQKVTIPNPVLFMQYALEKGWAVLQKADTNVAENRGAHEASLPTQIWTTPSEKLWEDNHDPS